ncbi:MAG: hypothetical protein ACM3SY_08090 [Candidatus Omnitrophota bacterium]
MKHLTFDEMKSIFAGMNKTDLIKGKAYNDGNHYGDDNNVLKSILDPNDPQKNDN